MADEPPKPPRNRGQFPPNTSGNPSGRPRKRQDAAPTTAIAIRNTKPDGTLTRRDGWLNSASGHGTHRDRRRLTRFGVDIVTDIEALQLRRSNWLAAAIIEDIAKEAWKRGWHLKCEDKDLDVAICKQAEHLRMDSILIEAACKAEEAGGAAIFPVLSGALGDLDQPLDETRIASVDAFHVFEPQELTPVTYEGDLNKPGFRKPDKWRLIPLNTGRSSYLPPQIIHASRLVIFDGVKVSPQTQPGQREAWGDSCLCRPWEVISDFGLSWGSAATLMQEYGKATYLKKDLLSMLSQADGLEQLDRHFAAMEMAWSTLRMRLADGEDKIEQTTGTLAGVSDILSAFQTLMAAACRRPTSKLFGEGSTGLNADDTDTDNWNAVVEGDRKLKWAPGHERLVRLMLLATGGPTKGKEPESWAVEYHPLHSPTEKEIAETRKIYMDIASEGVGVGIFSADDVAESYYGGDTFSGDIHINWERRKAQEAIDQTTPDQMTSEDMAAMGRGGHGGSLDLADMAAELDGLEVQPGGTDDTYQTDAALRTDAITVGSSDLPYDPYRNHGKFAPGSKKVKPKVGRPVAAAKESAAPHPHVVAARVAVNKAKAKPTPKNVDEAKAAVQKAKSSSKSSEADKITTSGTGAKDRPKPPRQEAVAVDHGAERIKTALSSSPNSHGDLIDAIGNGGIRSEGGRLTGLNPEAQAAVRGYFNTTAQKYGLPPKIGNEDHVLNTKSEADMGRANGTRYPSGRIDLNDKVTGHLGYHAEDKAYGQAPTESGVGAYRVMMHETIHSHGPNFSYDASKPSRFQLAEEMSTEMAARHITNDVHNFKIGEYEHQGYGDIMHEAVTHVSKATGVDFNTAHEALGRAALALKSTGRDMSPEDGLRHMAEGAVHYASQSARPSGKTRVSGTDTAKRASAAAEIHDKFINLADEMGKRYPWP